MKIGRVYIGSLLIFEKIGIADTFFRRFMGLMGKKSLDDLSGLLLIPCNQIHTFFMKLNIDAVFLDHDMKVISVMPCIDPGKVLPRINRARSVLELPEGMAAKYGIREGDILSVVRATTKQK
ncbi:MAG: DUF192 domain-containing protein [Clostridiales bacterium]|nr:DUF192 domain-containing protein [Clostridiales bacterium]